MMAVNAKVASPVAAQVTLVADDISEYGCKTSNDLFAIDRREAEALQLGWARRRFAELAPKIAALKEQADQNGR